MLYIHLYKANHRACNIQPSERIRMAKTKYNLLFVYTFRKVKRIRLFLFVSSSLPLSFPSLHAFLTQCLVQMLISCQLFCLFVPCKPMLDTHSVVCVMLAGKVEGVNWWKEERTHNRYMYTQQVLKRVFICHSFCMHFSIFLFKISHWFTLCNDPLLHRKDTFCVIFHQHKKKKTDETKKEKKNYTRRF